MKAREIIPGWPRGRSTTKCSVPPNPDAAPMVFRWSNMLGQDISKYAEDWMGYQAEEARKAKMMQQYYDDKMCEAMGDYVSDIRCPWNPTWPDAVRRLQPIVKRMAERERQFWKSLEG